MNHKVELAKGYDISRVLRLIASNDSNELAAFVQSRFRERYLLPLSSSVNRSGFALMAMACLTIESLESFYNGWPSTRRMREKPFEEFFNHWDQFGALRGHAEPFYLHVRCGLLHQAETTGGWRILRRGLLFDPCAKTINADLFFKQLDSALNAYAFKLKHSTHQSKIWKNFISKLNSICENAR